MKTEWGSLENGSKRGNRAPIETLISITERERDRDMARRRDEEELNVAKRGFKEAAREGNHEEEARWANVLGDIYKQRGEYVEALKWLRIDYEVSVKHLPCKQLLPTCQSLGDVYLRLDQFKDALIYQVGFLMLNFDFDSS